MSLSELILTKKTLIFLQLLMKYYQLTKNPLVDKISIRLLGLEFQSDNIIKSKAMNFF